METLRFLMISTHYPPAHLGGDAVFVWNLADELARLGHEVAVFHNPSVYKTIRHANTEIRGPVKSGLKTLIPYQPRGERLELAATLSFGLATRADERLKEVIREYDPQVIHWHNVKGFFGDLVLYEGRESIFTAHDYYVVCPRSNLLLPSLNPCEVPVNCVVCQLRWRKIPAVWRSGSRRVIRSYSGMKILCPSAFIAGRLRKDRVRVHDVLRNFVPDPAGKTPIVGSCSENMMLYVGMLEVHKGVRTLLEAFARSSSQHGFLLRIIGEGSLKRELAERVRQLGIGDRVKLMGFVSSDMLAALRKEAAVQVIPSEWFENAPLTVLEALAMGTPVIGSNIGGIPEILDSESGSIVYPAGSITHLAETIVQTWERRDELPQMRRRARRAYETRYTPEHHISAYLAAVHAAPNP